MRSKPLDHVAHLRTVADNPLETESLFEPAFQFEIGPFEPDSRPAFSAVALSCAMSNGLVK